MISRNREHVPEPGNEHRIVDRRGDRVATAGEQSGRDGALVSVKRCSYARVDRIAHVLHEGGVAQGQAARDRRLDGLDGPGDKAGGSDALKKHIAANPQNVSLAGRGRISTPWVAGSNPAGTANDFNKMRDLFSRNSRTVQ
jgi:hypothetical protein